MNTNPPTPLWVSANIVKDGARKHLPTVDIQYRDVGQLDQNTFTAVVSVSQSIALGMEELFYAKDQEGFLSMVGEELGSSLRWYILDSLNLTEREVVRLLIRTQNKGVKK